MIFVTIFVSASFSIPVILEIYRKGNDNILKKSRDEFFELPPVKFITRASWSSKFSYSAIESALCSLTAAMTNIKLIIYLFFLAIVIIVIFQILSFVFAVAGIIAKIFMGIFGLFF